MKFRVVAEAFNEIEKVTSRTEITVLLAELLKKANPNESAIISYLSLGELNPTYIGTKFNFAQKSIYKVVAQLLDVSEASIVSKMKKYGDIGTVIEESGWEPYEDKSLSISKVDKKLRAFLETSGTGSSSAKESALLTLLSEVDSISAKYISRVVIGKLRLGFSDMTLLDAFSWMEVGDKSLRKTLENAYNISADIGLIAKELKEYGIEEIEKIGVIPGVPIRPAAAERLSSAKAIVKKIGHCVAQPKLDGFRLQVHVFKNNVRFFSRNLQDMSGMFPELQKAVLDLKSNDFVAEGEAIAYDVETGTFLPFQETVKRRRKYGIEEMSQSVPLKLFLFDMLYINGKSILDETHLKRRKALLSLFGRRKIKEEDVVAPLEEVLIDTGEELEEYFAQNISDGLEGLVVKKIDSTYQPGKRNFNWIKLKREETGHLDDTIDCVILGYYFGHGKRASFGIGALLVGIYNKKEDRFETIAKIGTGLTDQEWRDQKKMCDEIAVKEKPKNVKCAKELYPDIWTSPELICQIRADEITLSPTHTAGATDEYNGYALRFPRLMGYRDDKSAEEATTVKEIKQLYKLQFDKERKVNKGKKKTPGQKTLF